MGHLLENYGMERITLDEEAFMNTIGYLVRHGKAVNTYYDTPYLYTPMGDAEFWLQTGKNEDGTIGVTDLALHSRGNCIWDIVYSGAEITPTGSSGLERIIVASKVNGMFCVLPVDIINADVLPGFMSGDHISAQVVAQPIDISYYATEEEFQAAMVSEDGGEKFMPDTGSLAAASFLFHRYPPNYEEGKEYGSDKFVQFKAVVTRLSTGTVTGSSEEAGYFVRCFAETRYGELQFDHTYEMVPKELRENIKVGSIICGTCLLSANVAINGYKDGPVMDHEHALQLMRYMFEHGEVERLRSVLSPSAVYQTVFSEDIYCGPDQIIDRMIYVHKTTPFTYFARLATLMESEEGPLDYPPGTRCIILATDEETNYEQAAFITLDDMGRIEKIDVVSDSRYLFKVDVPERIMLPWEERLFSGDAPDDGDRT